MKIRTMSVIVAIACVVAFSPRAYSQPILEGFEDPSESGTWEASDSDRLATAVFSIIDGDYLKIVLTNNADLTDENDELLMGLFFGFSGDTSLASPTVALNGGSSLQTYLVDIVNKDGTVIDPSNYPISLNGEFGYLTGINDINGGRGDYGISSSGLDPEGIDPGGWDGFGGDVIDSDQQIYTAPHANPVAPDGPYFGITGENGWDGSNHLAYIKHSVVITWQGAAGLDVDNIDQVHFLYGTDYDNVPIPEPATMLLLGTGLIGLGWFGRKKIGNS